MHEDLAKAYQGWSDAVREADRIANDPFKAPEQVIETIQPVLEAAWQLQIQYIVEMRAGN